MKGVIQMSENRELTWEEMLAMMQPNTEETVKGADNLDELFEELLGVGAPIVNPTPTPPAPTWTAPSFAELKQALPILGLTVKIKEEYVGNYQTLSFSGITGHIYDRNGMASSIKRLIRDYKERGTFNTGWKVKAVFNGHRINIPVYHLEVAPYIGALVQVEDNYEAEYRYFMKIVQEYYEFIDRRAIIDKYPATVKNVYDLESQEKQYNEA
jgi:hypothetical protein